MISVYVIHACRLRLYSLWVNVRNRGLKIKVTDCFRSREEQDALYAKGRTVPPIGKKYTVTNAPGSSYSSHHMWGTAFDFCRNDGRDAYDDRDGFFSKVGAIG